MRWRGSRFRRWITWLRSLLKDKAALDFDGGLGSESGFDDLVAMPSKRQRHLTKATQPGLRSLAGRPRVSGFRSVETYRPPIMLGSLSRTSQVNEVFSSNRVSIKALSVPISNLKRLSITTQLYSEIRSRQGSSIQTAHRGKPRTRLVAGMRSMVETSSQNRPEQTLSDSKNPRSATFSPPFSTRPKPNQGSAKPGREPPLWLSLGPHLARQFRK